MIYVTCSVLVVPALIIAICYTHIVYTIWKKARLVEEQNKRLEEELKIGGDGGFDYGNQQHQRQPKLGDNDKHGQARPLSELVVISSSRTANNNHQMNIAAIPLAAAPSEGVGVCNQNDSASFTSASSPSLGADQGEIDEKSCAGGDETLACKLAPCPLPSSLIGLSH